jgi:hypothetical protein
VTKIQKPKWNEDNAVAQFVEDELLEEERQFYMRYANCAVPGIRVGDIFERAEREAVEAAKRGNNFRPLAQLIHPDSPLVQFLHGAGLKPLPFAPETLALITDRLTGQFKPPHRGKPTETYEERIRGSPVHAVAEEMGYIEEILRFYYGREKGIHERAVTIAAQRWGIKRSQLENYLRSPRRMRKRP